MTKKAPVKVKRSPAKPKNKKAMKQSGRVVRMIPQAPPRVSLVQDPRYQQAVQAYEAGLRAMQERKFERAKSLFEKVVTGLSKELADRAAMHLNICNQNLNRGGTTFK